jgi:hypothetical protein
MSVNAVIQLGCVLVFFTVVLLGSRYGYKLYLRLFAKGKLKRFGFSLDDLKFSFDKIVFAIPLPTNQPELIQAKIGSFRTVEEIDSWVYPRLNGIRVLLKTEHGAEQLVAYLSVERMWLPILEQLLVEGKINRDTYRRISSCKLILPATKAEIIDDVHNQIHKKRFS